ncbi:hypothetical protein DID76_04090 [Candidatus Marinamargulisbacteria bacterium SCGC AG-414-C22]|nr:hypothetical protein DID76_04090 [Candidatus Marinamargulisbacteria bacterium SCGC AG-414-C22]
MSIIFLPFLVCLSLVFIHVYFGSFVLRRGIIFIDLALAQWAALGYLIGHWMDIHHPVSLFIFSFGFTVIASIALTLLKPLYHKNNLQEAVIGTLYIAANAGAIGLISYTGMEGHQLQEMLTGHLLFINVQEVLAAYGLYVVIALICVKCHTYFINAHSRAWDFIFYLLFGLVVTSSVKLVGILLVFSYLVLPLLCIVINKKSFSQQLMTGWLIGIVASVIGMGVSFLMDIPPSIAIILVLMGCWGVSILIHFQLSKSN